MTAIQVYFIYVYSFVSSVLTCGIQKDDFYEDILTLLWRDIKPRMSLEGT